MSGYEIGLVGLGTMGANLARNLAENGARVALFDPAPGTAARLGAELGSKGTATDSLARLCAELSAPRTVFLMVPAGEAVDQSIAELLPLLSPGDAIIDGGNSLYTDTERRVAACAPRGVDFMGFGLSGGSEGARRGPSIMAGGGGAVGRMAPLFRAIAAKAEGEACFAHVGPGGAGHFVKMLHNGIEYALMQLIAEAYQIMQGMLGMSAREMLPVFHGWAAGDQGGFLIECAARVLATDDPETGKPLIDLIEDRAGQKGTGKWAANATLDYGVAAPTLAEAVHARCLTALRPERIAAQQALGNPVTRYPGDRQAILADLGDALLASNISVHAQGFATIAAAAAEKNWPIDLGAVARIWRGGCIIRSRLLNKIASAYARDGKLANLLRDPDIWSLVSTRDAAWRRVAIAAISHGTPAPAFQSALAYAGAYRTGRLWANMIDGQRDLFGAHGFGRIDRPGRHHADWASS
ncbi:MAG: NADP-dependent phosphogluconate dehydrogenase [Alphaproteobacteria bacterium]|nr:NADP-dependent phosphogluconate dehydrogenase [Alphaproteobacteria bacterium]